MKPNASLCSVALPSLQKHLGLGCFQLSPLAALVTAAALLLALPAGATTYYSKGSLQPGTPANWSTTPDGTGTSPANFTTAADLFIIQAGHTMSGSTWVLTGALQINATGVLQLSTSPGITLGSLDNSGTVNLNTGSVSRTLTLNGNLVNNGVINALNTGQNVTIKFSGNATWTGSGDVSSGRVQLVVDAGTTLDISGLTTGLKFRNLGTMASSINGTLITGTQVINGNGDTAHTLTFSATATLVTANAGGVNGTFTWAGPLTFNPAASFNFNGSVAQVTGTLLPATLGSLTVNNASGVTLSQATTVNGALGLTAGALTTTSTELLTLGSSGSVTGSGHVNGPLAQAYSATGSKSFRVGKGGNIRPVTLNYTALTGTSTVTVEHFEDAMGGTLPANTAQFTSRYWSVAQSGGSGITFDLTLDGTGFSPVGTAQILQEGSPDASYSTTFASPAYTATGITSTGNFTLGDLTVGLDQLAFTTSAHTLAAGVASGTITVQLQDSGSTPKNAVSDLTVNLSTTSGAGAFRDTGDTTTISTVTITNGTDSVSFKYRDTAAPGTPILTAAATGIAAANQQQTVNVGAAAQFVFTTQPANGNVNYTLSPVVVQIRDAYGNNVSQNGIPITLTLNNGGGAVLSGTNPQNTDSTGKATFTTLAINAAGAGMSFDANDGSLPTATSATFDITYRQIVKAKTPTGMDQTASWTGGVVPGANDIAVINNSSVGTASNSRTDFGTSASWRGLIVSNWSANTGYAVSNTGTGTLTLGASGIAGTDINHSLTMSNHFALAAAQTWSWGDANSTGGTLNLNGDINNNGHALTLSGKQVVSAPGVISGNGGLIRTGDGRLTLSGANLYNGPTTVSSGTLRVDGSLAAGSAVTVAGGTLQGAGTVNGTVDVQAGGTLAPGSGAIGTLTINGPATNSGTIVAEITNGPSADKMIFNGNGHNLGGTLTVTNLGTLVNGTTYDLFDFDGGAPTGVPFAVTNLPGGLSHWNTSDLLVGGSITFTNNTPVAASFTNGVAIGGTTLIEVLGKYVSDADVGDTVTITGFTPASNGTVSIQNGTNLVYTSTNTAASDSFTYTVSDGLASATGTVTVSTYSAQGFNKLSGPVANGGAWDFSYLGIPGQKYALDESAQLVPPYTWDPVITNTATGAGAINYIGVPLSHPSGSFRTRHVP